MYDLPRHNVVRELRVADFTGMYNCKMLQVGGFTASLSWGVWTPDLFAIICIPFSCDIRLEVGQDIGNALISGRERRF